MAAGAVWVVSGILALVYQGVHAPGTFADYLVEGTFAAGLLLTAVGMVGLHALQKDNYGRIGRAGFYTVVVASLGQVLGTVVLLAGSTALAWLWCSRWGSWRYWWGSWRYWWGSCSTGLPPCKPESYRVGVG